MNNQPARDCSSRSFRSLLVTQFFGAFNDNLFKLLVSFFVVNRLVTDDGGTFYLSFAGAIFIVPFIIFASYSGFLSDRFRKSVIIRFAKVLEIIVMFLGFYFLLTENVTALFVVLFLMGVQSTIFSPSKYGILPEILDDENLSKGNGYLQLWSFLAIIVGTALGGVLSENLDDSGSVFHPGVIVVVVALVGYASSLFINETEPASSEAPFRLNPFREILEASGEIRRDRAISLTIIALAYFWFIGALFQLNIILYATQLLGFEESETGILLAVLGVGIGVGSVFAGKVSEGKVELGLVPVGSAGVALFSLLLGFSYGSSFLTGAFIFGIGVSSGMFVVPLAAYLQQNSPDSSRGRYLAASNFVSFSSMLLSAGVLWGLRDLIGLNAAHIFLVSGLLSIGATLYIVTVLPETLVRCVNWMLAHTFFRVKVLGAEHIPHDGGGLIVCNHISYIDAQLLLASIQRPVRFLMFRPLYESRLFHPIAKASGAIPISGRDGREGVARSLKEAQEAIRNGELVGIFAEGGISRTGRLLPFKDGYRTIMEGLDAPIIPAYIDRMWGSIFSYRDGKALWKWPKRIPYPVTVCFGKPRTSSIPVYELREDVLELSAQAFRIRDESSSVLPAGFIRQAQSYPLKTCVADEDGQSLSYLSLLSRALLVGKLVTNTCKEEARIGVCMEPGLRSVVVNLALSLQGIVVVNLDSSYSPGRLREIASQVPFQSIITDDESSLSGCDSFRLITFSELTPHGAWMFEMLLLPLLYMRPRVIFLKTMIPRLPQPDTIATIVFSHGKNRKVPGVCLSHENIASNVAALYDSLQLQSSDLIGGALGFDHAYGFTTNLWLPLLTGCKIIFPRNRLNYCGLVQLIHQHRITTLFELTDSLSHYLEEAKNRELKSLEHLVVGGSPVDSSVLEQFRERFEVLPLEGYGSSELSPVALLNFPDFDEGKRVQKGGKIGTVGSPLPGVAIRIARPGSVDALPAGETGTLLIKGPNIMRGYLNDPVRTEEVIKDSWFVTGDTARVDEEGFVEILERAPVFAGEID